MAITHIHAVTGTPQQALDYATNNKTGKLKDNISDSIKYATSDKKEDVTYYTLSAYQYCQANTAKDNFHDYAEQGRGKFRKEKPRTKSGNEVLMWHLVQSFDEDIPPHTVNEIGQKLAREVFKNFACVISTHTNTDNIHNHIMICAWDRDGRKWNDDHKSKRLIREVSDRLCEEYGLHVLYKTSHMNLISYKDADGKTRYYEPTERKNELIRKREQGNISSDDVNSIRNTVSYEQANEKIFKNRETIKFDIDNLLPAVRSYDELLARLRDLGYTINDKNKAGGWLKYVSFKSPLQDKATRDDKIGDDGFYSRENLTAYINDRRNEPEVLRAEEAFRKENNGLPYYAVYDYENIDVPSMDEDIRIITLNNGGYSVAQRNQSEKDIIRDIKRCDIEVKGLIDMSGIYRIIEEQKKADANKKKYYARLREEQLIMQIRESFDNLRFIEQHNIYSYDQLIILNNAVRDNYNRNIKQVADIENLVNHFNGILSIPGKAAALNNRINAGRGDSEYMFEHYNEDLFTLNTYKSTMKKYNISNSESEEALRDKIANAEAQLVPIKNRLESYSLDIAGYERCMRVFERIYDDARNKVFENNPKTIIVKRTYERER